ncbi:hypothetical protein BDV95DRAFT_485707 [Massariosphaeria phaeospora]|uniref:Uncharacterized protein n=1 Tax=Massariosphaeria phaeospora TaxID=100035 RepID=A0A7C8MAD6_9PLEO|nr:hypothetical protein BDV95DRAFT_485707 [Massariosphaeria phaeospora]
MLLHRDPSLAELPGYSPAQLESLSRSVEQKKQRLEQDIHDYIRRKQEELRDHERELVEQYRPGTMERAESNRDAAAGGNSYRSTDVNIASNTPATAAQTPGASADSRKLGPEEKAKRTKHTRVHKREKELFGLVTPIFLPLLEAGEATPAKKKKERKRLKSDSAGSAENSPPNSELGSPSRDAGKGKESHRSRSTNSEEKMECHDFALSADIMSNPDSGKKSKRSPMKKSSLRHNSTPKSRRKRVSLVIDDQIVLPADSIVEPPLTSPSETTVSTISNSTGSLDDSIDPQLVPRNDTPVHQDAVHHSIPHSMTLSSASLSQHTSHAVSDSPPSPSTMDYEPTPASATAATLPSPSPPRADTDPDLGTSLPQYASAAPIYANEPAVATHDDEEGFDTYVGGISGSGADNVDQAGSYGYPSSLGASYLESYMQSRPLSVRMAAADKAGLKGREKEALVNEERNEERELGVARRDDEEEDEEDDEETGMEMMGDMEGF